MPFAPLPVKRGGPQERLRLAERSRHPPQLGGWRVLAKLPQGVIGNPHLGPCLGCGIYLTAILQSKPGLQGPKVRAHLEPR
jgi:hypothetical protein